MFRWLIIAGDNQKDRDISPPGPWWTMKGLRDLWLLAVATAVITVSLILVLVILYS